tara:strand:- start:582 stop:884 length:303 start_codon:yes stop_codon:yes gene_type:complete
MAIEKFRRDLENEFNHCCAACGSSIAGLCIDHVITRKDGGKDVYENLQILCYICNSEIKGEISTTRLPARTKCNNESRVVNARREFRKWVHGFRKARRAA